MTKPGLEVKDLSVTLSGQSVLSNLNLRIESGQFAVLSGASGCGKTTLLRAIAGEIVTPKGAISVPMKIGYAQQSAPLFPWLSVLDNLLLASQLNKQSASEKAVGLLRKVGLENAADVRPKALSGGMRSRVSLIRAFMNEPKLVLLDEPFNGLDIQNRERLQAITCELWQETHTTVLLVSHDLDEAIRLSDRILVLSSGGDRFTMDALNTISRPRSARSIDLQPLPEFRVLWNQMQSSIQ